LALEHSTVHAAEQEVSLHVLMLGVHTYTVAIHVRYR